MVECNDYDEYIKLKSDNEKLKKDLEEIKSHNAIVLETLDHDEELILENEKLEEENKKLKEEKNNDILKEENKKLKMGLSKFARGKHLQSELLMNTVIKMDRTELYSRWGIPSSPGSPSGSKHPGLKGDPLVPGQ